MNFVAANNQSLETSDCKSRKLESRSGATAMHSKLPLILGFVLSALLSGLWLAGGFGYQPRVAAYHRLPAPPILEEVGCGAKQDDGASRPDKITRRTSKPYDGDLSIFEDPKRAEHLQIDRVMDILGIKDGSGVADIGAASGWFTVRAARRVTPSGRVYAVDINESYLAYIKQRAVQEGFANIETILGKEDDPMLSPQSVDAALILKTYHEIAQPVRLLKRLRGALRPGARVGIIDRNGRGDDHGIQSAIVVAEAGRAGFALVKQYDFVKPDGMDYFLVFSAREPSN